MFDRSTIGQNRKRCRKIQPGNSKFPLVPGSLKTYSNATIADLINKDTQHLFVFKLEVLVLKRLK
ncbi:hypothetical protein FF38_00196 [Lucilia cuprina]|uniref:Uncharacterized protein n=1 Tax=Lucilia cuprina TaxID=7375 RepID=A0A0L0BTL4_LUCCU|nr:hypothetical protein FF38_00196 [Lucilia cuprina]